MNKLKNIKIVFIDIDGTLVNKKHHITIRTRKSIKRLVEKGIYVVLISGRDILYTTEKSKRALASNIIISSNGSEIYDYKNKNVIFMNVIDNEKIEKVWDYCNKNELGFVIKAITGKYINKYLIGEDKEGGKLITRKNELKKILFSQIVFITNDLDKINNAREFVESLGLVITNCSRSFLEKKPADRYRLDVNNKKISKGIAVAKLLEHLSIKKEESLCFGDYNNDISMFNECGFKVAMGNACDKLKEKADFVTYSNDKNGVAFFLNKYLK